MSKSQPVGPLLPAAVPALSLIGKTSATARTADIKGSSPLGPLRAQLQFIQIFKRGIKNYAKNNSIT